MVYTNKPNVNINFVVHHSKNRCHKIFHFFTYILALNKLQATFFYVFHYKTVIDKTNCVNEFHLISFERILLPSFPLHFQKINDEKTRKKCLVIHTITGC
jgi:hypothetical protein